MQRTELAKAVNGLPLKLNGNRPQICFEEWAMDYSNCRLLYVTNPSPALEDRFGYSVAVDNATIVVGAPFDDTAGTNRGAAYMYGPAMNVPTLRIISEGTGFATISWTPTNSPGFVLQFTDILRSNCVNASSGATNPVTVQATNAARLYRLLKP